MPRRVKRPARAEPLTTFPFWLEGLIIIHTGGGIATLMLWLVGG